MSKRSLTFAMALAAGAVLHASGAAAQMPNPYGAPIDLATAKSVAAASIAEARKNNWTMAVAIVDIGGDLVYFEKIDGTQTASVQLAIAKANSAVKYKRATSTFRTGLAAGGDGLRLLTYNDMAAVDGGQPIVVAGKIVGAVGASGGTFAQDDQVATAGSSTQM
jgi:glc operon protein GlcG